MRTPQKLSCYDSRCRPTPVGQFTPSLGTIYYLNRPSSFRCSCLTETCQSSHPQDDVVSFVSYEMLVSSLRHVLTSTAAAAATAALSTVLVVSWTQLDCQPSLFCTDFLQQLKNKLTTKAEATVLSRHDRQQQQQQERIWIIGASSGIGYELARQLAIGLDYSDIIVSARSVSALEELSEKCQEDNPTCRIHIVPLDVTDLNQLHQVVQSLPCQIHTVVLNAGLGHLSLAQDTTSETIQLVMQVSAIWPMMIVPLLLQYQVFSSLANLSSEPKISPTSATSSIRNKNNDNISWCNSIPHLMVTSSVGGRLPIPLAAIYSASKHALHGYFRSLVCEHDSLHVDLICPGPVENDFLIHAKRQQQQQQDIPTTSSSISSSSPESVKRPGNPFKLSVQRTAHLMGVVLKQRRQQRIRYVQQQQQQSQKMSLVSSSSSSMSQIHEYWIAKQPTLTMLYIQYYLPCIFQWMCIHWFGPKRKQLYQQGKNLYETNSWWKHKK